MSIQIFGCFILVSLFGSALFFPVKEKQKYHLAANEEGKSVKPSEEESEKNEENSKWKKNPIVKMFILTKWSLVKDPHFILTVLGSAYSFNALLTFLFYLPLYASTIDLSLENEENSSCQKVNTRGIIFWESLHGFYLHIQRKLAKEYQILVQKGELNLENAYVFFTSYILEF